ncbi:MAG: NUDIX hydrolase [Thaumarchaeota archaeon]|nr:NUDIX hydrolase [Nitrososphaerota archaeon]MCZ6725498.1 NUDIX hydrolase [Nitrososphaerota archaeon]
MSTPPDADQLNEETIESKTIYSGKILGLRRDTVKIPDGKVAIREIVEHGGAVGIVAFTDEGKIILVKQFRKATNRDLIEIPAGTLEKGEEPIHCASRELEEETGYVASTIKPVLSFYLAPGYSTELMHIFFANDLRKTRQRLEEDEALELIEVDLDEAISMVKRNDIEDAKTITSLLAAKFLFQHNLDSA